MRQSPIIAEVQVEWLRTFEAAKYLGVSISTLEAWRHYKKGPSYYKRGKLVYYAISELNNFITLGTSNNVAAEPSIS